MRVKRSELQYAAKVLSVATQDDNANPNWGIIRITGVEGAKALRLGATDSIMAGTVGVETEDVIEKGFDLKIPVKLFSAFSRTAPAEMCELVPTKGKLNLSSGRLKTVVATRNDLTVNPFVLEDPHVLLTTTYGELISGLRAVDWVTKEGGDREAFANPHLVFKEGKAVFVGIHSSLIVTKATSIPVTPMEGSEGITLSSRFVAAIGRLGLDPEQKVELQINANSTKVGLLVPGRMYVAHPLVQCKLPPYEKVLDKRFQLQALTIDRGEVTGVLSGLNTLSQADRGFTPITMSIDSTEWLAGLRGALVDADDSFEILDWSEEEVEATEFSLNLPLLMKGIGIMDSEKVLCHVPEKFEGNYAAALPFYAESEDGTTVFALHQYMRR